LKNTYQLTRREFLKLGATCAAGVAAQNMFGANVLTSKNIHRPNFLFINVDQLSWDVIGLNGCTEVKTPNIDRILKSGVSFNRSYSANPVCSPARTSWYTGREPCEHGVLFNGMKIYDSTMPDMGQVFSSAGYDTFFCGKWHVGGRDSKSSFIKSMQGAGVSEGEHQDAVAARAMSGYLMSRSNDKPFLGLVCLINPHDCCQWWKEIHVPIKPFPLTEITLPNLPPNFDKIPEREPQAVRNAYRNPKGRSGLWDKTWWRYYIYGYHRLIEMVDKQVGLVLDTLARSQYADNTFVIFSSDHGDGHGCHQTTGKQFLYDEAARVPLVVSYPGKIKNPTTDSNLVSGVDLFPTLCDYAGITAPPKLRGKSLRPILEGDVKKFRPFLRSETMGSGRMIVSDQYKYIMYKDDPNEQLFDMTNDSGETKNLAFDSQYTEVHKDHMSMLTEYDAMLDHAPVKPKKTIDLE
jgi:arylsulfatase A-like enzyme